MPSKILSARGVSIFLLLAVALPLARRAIAEDAIRIELKKPEDSAKQQLDGASLTLSLTSKSGIGKCTLVRGDQPWPKEMTVCMYLSGLEMFRVSAGEIVLAAAVSSTELQSQRVSRIVGKDEVPYDPNDPLWISIQATDKEGKTPARIPLDKGHFKITLPAALWKDNPAEIQLEWIDFYRG